MKRSSVVLVALVTIVDGFVTGVHVAVPCQQVVSCSNERGGCSPRYLTRSIARSAAGRRPMLSHYLPRVLGPIMNLGGVLGGLELEEKPTFNEGDAVRVTIATTCAAAGMPPLPHPHGQTCGPTSSAGSGMCRRWGRRGSTPTGSLAGSYEHTLSQACRRTIPSRSGCTQ